MLKYQQIIHQTEDKYSTPVALKLMDRLFSSQQRIKTRYADCDSKMDNTNCVLEL